MLELPTIRVELDHMRQSIVTALNTYSRDMQDAVDAAMRNVVRTFDYQRAVEVEADKAIAEGVRATVASAIRNAFYDETLREAVNSAVREAIARNMAKDAE